MPRLSALFHSLQEFGRPIFCEEPLGNAAPPIRVKKDFENQADKKPKAYSLIILVETDFPVRSPVTKYRPGDQFSVEMD